MRSSATTVAEYLKSLPEDRRKEIAAVRRAVRLHLPHGYEEVMNWGMITWQVPFRTYPHAPSEQPLCYAALAAQKHYNALYLMGCYVSPERLAPLRQAFTRSGRTLDMGKSCVRFTRSVDLPLDAIGALVAGLPPDAYIALYERARASGRSARKTTRKATRAATGSTRKRAAAPNRTRS